MNSFRKHMEENKIKIFYEVDLNFIEVDCIKCGKIALMDDDGIISCLNCKSSYSI